DIAAADNLAGGPGRRLLRKLHLRARHRLLALLSLAVLAFLVLALVPGVAGVAGAFLAVVLLLLVVAGRIGLHHAELEIIRPALFAGRLFDRLGLIFLFGDRARRARWRVVGHRETVRLAAGLAADLVRVPVRAQLDAVARSVDDVCAVLRPRLLVLFSPGL